MTATPRCIMLRGLLLLGQLWSHNMQKLNSNEHLSWPTFIVVVLHSEDPSPGGTRVVDDSFDIQWFDCEWVNDPDGDPL